MGVPPGIWSSTCTCTWYGGYGFSDRCSPWRPIPVPKAGISVGYEEWAVAMLSDAVCENKGDNDDDDNTVMQEQQCCCCRCCCVVWHARTRVRVRVRARARKDGGDDGWVRRRCCHVVRRMRTRACEDEDNNDDEDDTVMQGQHCCPHHCCCIAIIVLLDIQGQGWWRQCCPHMTTLSSSPLPCCWTCEDEDEGSNKGEGAWRQE